MDEVPFARRRRAWIIAAAVAVVVIVAAGLLLLPSRTHGGPKRSRSSASLALARLDANDGESYVGSIGDATDPVRLRRAVRREFRSGSPRRDRRGGEAAKRCAADLRRTDNSQGRVVLLADATLSGTPVVVAGVADHGRVVVFVADAVTCDVRMAQSL